MLPFASAATSATPASRPPEIERHLHSSDDAHIVQFYEDDSFLADAVAEFLQAGIRNGEALVVLASQAHNAQFAVRLAARGVDVPGLCATGHLEMLDGAVVLPQMIVAGMPDP